MCVYFYVFICRRLDKNKATHVFLQGGIMGNVDTFPFHIVTSLALYTSFQCGEKLNLNFTLKKT